MPTCSGAKYLLRMRTRQSELRQLIIGARKDNASAEVHGNNWFNAIWVFHSWLISLCFLTMSSTTEGSASVDTSPNSSCWLEAIFLKMRRMIFPERVLGRPGTICVCYKKHSPLSDKRLKSPSCMCKLSWTKSFDWSNLPERHWGLQMLQSSS